MENNKEIKNIKDELKKSVDTITDTFIDTFIDKLWKEITGVLKEEDKKRISELEKRVGELEKKKGEKAISDAEFNKVLTLLDYIRKEPEETNEKIEKIDTIEILSLDKIRIIENLASTITLLTEKRDNLPDLNKDMLVLDFLRIIQKEITDIKIKMLHTKGITLLKEKAYRQAFVCFDMITEIDDNIISAWLNKGVALGKLGGLDNIEKEIRCYDTAVDKGTNYEKAEHNRDKAERNKKIAFIQSLFKNIRIPKRGL